MVNAFIVVLERDVRQDEIEGLVTALKQIKNVVSVVPHNNRMEDTVAYNRVKARVFNLLWETFNRELP